MANEQPPQPLFIFRGHKVGVTALAHLQETLISGDEEGNIHFWSLTNFRLAAKWEHVAKSKIQSLKIIKLIIESVPRNILVCQSRDHGVRLLICDDIHQTDLNDLTVLRFDTCEASFSRGDALTIDEETALLAYPSNVESYMVAVRCVRSGARIHVSGNASREACDEMRERSAVFDIRLISSPLEKNYHHLFCGYEDGSVVISSINLQLTTKIPELDVTGLKIDVIRKINLGLNDFVSAIDVALVSSDYVIVCGSPQKELIFCTLSSDFNNKSKDNVLLKRRGTSVVSIRHDSKLVAMASWDNSIRLYSMRSKSLLVCLDDHLKQIQSIIFVKKSSQTGQMMYCASLDGTISMYEIYS